MAQGTPDSCCIVSEVTSDSLLYSGPTGVRIDAYATVRYQNDADAYIRFSGDSASVYTIYFAHSGEEAWNTLTTTQREYVIPNLMLDTMYTLFVRAGTDTSVFQASGVVGLSTYPQRKPLAVSDRMYDALSDFFVGEHPNTPFCTFMDSRSEVHLIEKLSFLQGYAYEDAKLTRSTSTSVSEPQRFTGVPNYNPLTGTCLPQWAGGCNCDVLTTAFIVSKPNNGVIERPKFLVFPPSYKVIPTQEVKRVSTNKRDNTDVVRVKSGVAKYISLFNHENNGGMGYRTSNVPGAGNKTGVTSLGTTITFTLGCMTSQGFTTNLPVGCDCERPLRVDYEYSSRMWVKADSKDCIWSKGAAAQAEDMAFVVVGNRKTEELMLLAAGKAMISRKFEHPWNPQFWIELVQVAGQAAGLFLGNQNPSQDDIDGLVDEIEDLITTPFTNNIGISGTIDEEQIFVSGLKNLTLKPNEPLVIGLYNAYYLDTRGYGCYEAEAAIASDYLLLGVVESEQDPFDQECCSDKYAAYSLASLGHSNADIPVNTYYPPFGPFGFPGIGISIPAYSSVDIEPIHSGNNLREQIGGFLASYGDWYPRYGYKNPTITGGSGVVEIAPNYDFDRIYGVSCIDNDGLADTTQERSSLFHASYSTKKSVTVEVYPTITTDHFINMKVEAPFPVLMETLIYGVDGRVVKAYEPVLTTSGAEAYALNLEGILPGFYLLTCHDGITNHFFKIIIH